MPTICVFHGITIMMYLREKEHNPPHVHAFYGDDAASFYISSGEIFDGNFPLKEKQLVKEFIQKNKEALLQMWETGIYKKLEGVN